MGSAVPRGRKRYTRSARLPLELAAEGGPVDLEGARRAAEVAAGALRHGDIAANLRNLGELLERLDWVFQGHFTGEEDGLFLPAEDVLSAGTFATMAEQMAALEAARAP